MYKIIQFIRHKLPFVWKMIDYGNSSVFRARYGKKLKQLNMMSPTVQGCICYSMADADDTDDLVCFFNRQSEESFRYFKPHQFDRKSIATLINNPSFLMYVAKDGDKVVGYAFMRCFANGKAFRGKIVDVNYRCRGIAKEFGRLMTDASQILGIGLFGTISKKNLASMASSKAVNEVRVIEELPEDYLLIQYLPKH